MKKILFLFLVFLGISANGFCGYIRCEVISENGENSKANVTVTTEINMDAHYCLHGAAYSTCMGGAGGYATLSIKLIHDDDYLVNENLLGFRSTSETLQKYSQGYIDDFIYKYSVITYNEGDYSRIFLSFYWF